MTPPSPRKALLEQFARIGRAAGSPARLDLLDLLAQGEKPVETLARQAGLSVTNTSNHLKELRTAGLVSRRRDGTSIFYRLADPAVHLFLRSLQDIAVKQLPEVRELVREVFSAPEGLEPLDAEALLERMHTDEVLVLDVRPPDEYEAGHLPGAVSLPLGELERRLAEIPLDREVVAYCRGPYCVMAVRAVELLRSRGVRARRMEEGLPDWRARGLPVAVGAGS